MNESTELYEENATLEVSWGGDAPMNIWTEENRADPDVWNQMITAYKALKAAPPLTDLFVLGEPLTREDLKQVFEAAGTRASYPEDMEEGTEFLKNHYSFMNPAAESWRNLEDRVKRLESAVFQSVGKILGCEIYIEHSGDEKAEVVRRILDRALRDLAVFGKDVE